jgi:hypothetical protein
VPVASRRAQRREVVAGTRELDMAKDTGLAITVWFVTVVGRIQSPERVTRAKSGMTMICVVNAMKGPTELKYLEFSQITNSM